MSATRISITGVDGTGKTTLIRSLREQWKNEPARVQAFRAPQYHEDPDSPFARLSAAFEAIGALADRKGDPLLKTTALFLGITLYGDVEAHYLSTFRPAFLFSERQALADSLTYSVFYKSLMNSPLNRAELEQELITLLGRQAWEAVLSWLEVLRFRSPRWNAGVDFWQLPLMIRGLFELPPLQLLGELRALYHSEVPERIIVLRLEPEQLQARIEARAAVAGASVTRELHEQSQILIRLQQALVQSAEALKQVRPDLDVRTLDTGKLDIEASRREILRIAGLS